MRKFASALGAAALIALSACGTEGEGEAGEDEGTTFGAGEGAGEAEAGEEEGTTFGAGEGAGDGEEDGQEED